jgi:predicted  nucleic acid-binding Zn-ribbon protein
MTIKEYAASRNITYEAARQAVEKAKPEIDKFIRKQGRTRYLLPEAEQLLDRNRKGTRITTLKKEAAEKTDRIDELNDTIDKLKNEIIVLQKQLLDEKQKALEASVTVARLEAIADTSKKQEEKIDRLQAELSLFERTVFGLYRKRKQ